MAKYHKNALCSNTLLESQWGDPIGRASSFSVHQIYSRFIPLSKLSNENVDQQLFKVKFKNCLKLIIRYVCIWSSVNSNTKEGQKTTSDDFVAVLTVMFPRKE